MHQYGNGFNQIVFLSSVFGDIVAFSQRPIIVSGEFCSIVGFTMLITPLAIIYSRYAICNMEPLQGDQPIMDDFFYVMPGLPWRPNNS